MIDLRGKTAIVTGASRGIGKSIRETLCDCGAMPIWCSSEQFDIKHESNVKVMFSVLMLLMGKLDILVNSAGVTKVIDVMAMDEVEWDRVMDINLKGTFFCCQEAMKIMKRQKSGRIINIASTAGANGGFFIGAHYAASKAGVICLTKTLAQEMAPYNVTVNCVAPGLIDAGMTRTFPKVMVDNLIKNIPLRRLGTAQEVANVVAFLASDLSSYITGATIFVNGGSYMGGI